MPEQVKHVADAGVFSAGVLATFNHLTPLLTFVVLAATTVWAIFRIYEIWLSISIKRRQLKLQEIIKEVTKPDPPGINL